MLPDGRGNDMDEDDRVIKGEIDSSCCKDSTPHSCCNTLRIYHIEHTSIF